MWFKNLYLYKFEKAFTLSAEELHGKLLTKPFVPCLKDQRESSGWVAPLGKQAESLVHAANGFILLTLAHQERILPGSVIQDELEVRIDDIEALENRKVSNREKKELREEVEFDLLPHAFTRTRQLDAWIDPHDQWLVVNTSSPTQAERLTGMLRDVLGSLPVAAPKTQSLPASIMTQWLTEGILPPPFKLGEACELRSRGDDQSVATFKNHELLADEVKSNLDSGKQVSKLMLTWDEKITFILTDNLQIRGIKFLDVFDEMLSEQDPQSHAEHKDIEFTLMTGEVSHLLKDLIATMGEP